MENKTLEKTMDFAGSAMKLAANLSEAKKETPKETTVHKSDDNSNKATTGSQNIQIALDTGKKREPKPIEKHIHEFPEARALTPEECELALKRAQMDYELKKSSQVFEQKFQERDWQHKLEVEKKNERRTKIRRIVAGVLGALGIGYVGYSVWSDYRNNKDQPVVQKALPDSVPVKAEGKVK